MASSCILQGRQVLQCKVQVQDEMYEMYALAGVYEIPLGTHYRQNAGVIVNIEPL